MQHKALRLFLGILFSALIGFQTHAQNLTRSPYSIIGVGDVQFQGTSLQSAIGQVGQGLRRVSDINMLNPASYSSLKYTVIDGGVLYSQGVLTQGSKKSDIDNSSFTYFMLGLPVSLKHKMGLVFSLTPYTSTGFNVSTSEVYPYYTATTQMVGTGGLSKFTGGFGSQVAKNLSAGINVSYIFGQLQTEQLFLIPDQYGKFNVRDTRNRIVGGTQLQGGVQYHKEYEKGVKKEKYAFTIGATYGLSAALKGKQERFVGTLAVGSSVYPKDTIYYNDAEKGAIDLPYSFSFGGTWEKKDVWMIGADINTTNWSTYRSFGKVDSLQNSFGVNIGGSYVPNYMDYKNYFNRIEYRAGARFDAGNLILSDQAITSYALSLGMGLPLGKTKSKLNIAGEYFVRGTTNSNLIKEEYLRIVIGLNFSDRWFQRYKYD
jgi:hypothetical protein